MFFPLKRFHFNIFLLCMKISVLICDCTQEKANEHGMEPREFANLSQAELSLRMGTDASLMGGTWKKGRKGKVRSHDLLRNGTIL